MNEVIIFTGSFDSSLRIPYASGGIKAGFPSPAQDYMEESLDFNRDIIRHPAATFYGRVKGDSMVDAGISDGDIVVIDRALEPSHGDIVVAFINGEFTIKYLDTAHRDEGFILLVPANKKYEPIKVYNDDSLVIWGVVAWTIKKRVNRQMPDLP